MEELKRCPACGGSKFAVYITCNDYLVSQETFQIQCCAGCQLLFTNPRPEPEALGSYYQSEAYISHDDTKRGLIDTMYRQVRRYTLQEKEKLIRQTAGGVGAVLDYGCGTGVFLQHCAAAGWHINGFEPDPDARKLAEQRTQIQVLKDLNSLQQVGTQDVITLWHVLEHVADLHTTLDRLTALLQPGGAMVIAVPNPNSADAKKYGANWAAYDVPRHLYHFTPEVLQRTLARHNLTFEKHVPMRFDAYYIALMSTRYRDGKTNYLESLWAGLQSNIAASQTGQYSSLTYVFRKN